MFIYIVNPEILFVIVYYLMIHMLCNLSSWFSLKDHDVFVIAILYHYKQKVKVMDWFIPVCKHWITTGLWRCSFTCDGCTLASLKK